MRRRVVLLLMPLLGLVTACALLNSIGRQVLAYPSGWQGSPRELTIDVACDARTYRQNNVDPAASGSQRGDTFIVSGKIYPGGTIPNGNAVFSPDNPGSIGNWTCRGVWLVSSQELASGASPAFDTSQIYLLPDETKQIFSEGLEGPTPTLRAVNGGTGSMSGVSGQVRQQLLGTNATGLFNFRFTFRISD
jgi:hypothetical protein